MLKFIVSFALAASTLSTPGASATPATPPILADASLEPATLNDRAIAPGTYQKYQRILNQPCETYEKIKKNIRYTICTVDEGGGESYLLSASSSLVNEGDGIGFWFTEEGDLYSIRFFHSDETFIYGTNGTLLAELIYPDRVKTDFSTEERSRLEALAKDTTAIEEILNVFLE